MSFIKTICVIIFGFVVSLSNISGLRDLVRTSQMITLSGWEAGETVPNHHAAEIEMDYFFGETSLRSSARTCKGDELKIECRQMCGADNYKCIFDQCICLGREAKKVKPMNDENLPPSKNDMKKMLNDFEDLIEVLRRQLDLVEQVDEQRPALRHHIAHFCPNLEKARECIRTCMQVGKPAFCGKDHKCYCGHKYDEHSKDELIDVDDVYANYRDLYEKYFGTESNNPIIINGK